MPSLTVVFLSGSTDFLHVVSAHPDHLFPHWSCREIWQITHSALAAVSGGDSALLRRFTLVEDPGNSNECCHGTSDVTEWEIESKPLKLYGQL